MRAQSFSDRSPTPFASLVYELCETPKISKKPLNKLNKMLKDLVRAGNCHQVMCEIKWMGKNKLDLESMFNGWSEKLVSQGSGMFNEKKKKIDSIRSELLAAGKVVDTNRRQDIDESIGDKKKDITRYDNHNCSIEKKIELLENKSSEYALLLDMDSEEFNRLREERLAIRQNKIDAAEVKYKDKRQVVQNKIEGLRHGEKEILKLASDNGFDAQRFLNDARSKKIYDKTDLGSGPTTWAGYLCSDKFVMGKFGYEMDHGRREYVELKVPNDKGRRWQEMMSDFNKATVKRGKLKSAKASLEWRFNRDVELINRSSKILSKNMIKLEIVKNNNKVSELTEMKEKNQRYIAGINRSIGELEREKALLHSGLGAERFGS